MARRSGTRSRSPAAELDRWQHGLRSVLDAPPKRRGRRFVKVVGALLVLVIAAAAVLAGLTFRYATTTLAHVTRQPCPACGGAAGASDAITLMFVGSDSRSDIPRSEAIHFCVRLDCSDMSGPEHSDAIMILRIFPSLHRASVLSIPRDLNVPIAGTARRDRINVAYEGGPERLVETIRSNFGIPIDHFIDADFVGFRSIVNVFGGLNVYFPTPTRDVMSGLYVPTAGCIHLDPNSTLAYVRSRHTQFLTNGRWRYDPLSDLSRVTRQQDFMRRLLGKIKMIRNPFVAKRVVDGAIHFFKLDDKFSIWDAFRFVRAMRGVAPETLQATTLPVDNISVGGASELRLQQPEASGAIDSFLRGPSTGPQKVQTAPAAGGVASQAGTVTSPPKC